MRDDEATKRRRGGFFHFPWLTRADADAAERTARPTADDPGERRFEAAAEAFINTAHRVQFAWLSFLVVMLFLATTAANTTAKMIFLETGAALPIVNITVPLAGFYVAAPALFVVMHIYMMTILISLARTSQIFEDTLQRAGLSSEDEQAARGRLGSAFFAQMISGRDAEQRGWISLLYALIAVTTVVLFPVLLLLLMQLKFLPYQSDAISGWHRMLVVLDVVAVMLLWPLYRRGRGTNFGPHWRGEGSLRPWISFAGFAAFSAVAITASLAASFPCRPKDVSKDWSTCEGSVDPWLRGLARLIEPNVQWVLGGAVHNDDYGPYTAFAFANRLELDGETLVDPGVVRLLIEARQETLAQRVQPGAEPNDRGNAGQRSSFDASGRNFRAADFYNADLRIVNFEDCDLKRALLDEAHLNSTYLWFADLRGTSLKGAKLARASLVGAQLQGADLSGAELTSAELLTSRLQGATLAATILEGANLVGTRLQGTNLSNARLKGANLSSASLQGADLSTTSLAWANLINSDLRGAQLPKASRLAAGLFVTRSQLWRAKLPAEAAELALLHANTRTPGAFFANDESHDFDDKMNQIPLKPIPFTQWRDEILAQIPNKPNPSRDDKNSRAEIAKRLARLDPNLTSQQRKELGLLPQDDVTPVPDAYFLDDNTREPQFQQLIESMCSTEDWPYAQKRLEDSTFWQYFSPARREQMLLRLSGANSTPSTCPGAKGISAELLAGISKATANAAK